MDLRFTPPHLRQLDLAGTEVLVATLASDERPPRGVAGLADWRLAGRISRIIQSGFATGEVGEVLLVPGKPKLPFDKIVLFGVGARADFNERVFRAVVERMLETLAGPARAHARWWSCRVATSAPSRRSARPTCCSRASAAARSTTCGRWSSRPKRSAPSRST